MSAPYSAIARYPYTPDPQNAQDDLPFETGQVINVTEVVDDDWLYGSYTGSSGNLLQGYFPKNFVEAYTPETNYEENINTEQSKAESESESEPEGAPGQESESKAEPESTTVPYQEPKRTLDPMENVEANIIHEPENFKNKLQAFNVSSAPVLPDQKLKEPSFVKKSFVAASQHSSYMPPTFGSNKPIKIDKKPDVVSDNIISENTKVEEVEAPRMTLKERMKLLQKQQEEEQEAMESALKRKEERKKTKQHQHHQHHEHELTSNNQGANIQEVSVDDANPFPSVSEGFGDENTALKSSIPEKILESETYSDHNDDYDQENEANYLKYNEGNAEDNKAGNEYNNKEIDEGEKDDAGVIDNSNNDEEEEDDDNNDDAEDEEDEEELKRRKLRERMAKLSGGMGMMGMIGMMGMGSPAPTHTPAKQEKKKVKKTETSDGNQPTAVPITSPAVSVPSPAPKNQEEEEHQHNENNSNQNNPKDVMSTVDSSSDEDDFLDSQEQAYQSPVSVTNRPHAGDTHDSSLIPNPLASRTTEDEINYETNQDSVHPYRKQMNQRNAVPPLPLSRASSRPAVAVPTPNLEAQPVPPTFVPSVPPTASIPPVPTSVPTTYMASAPTIPSSITSAPKEIASSDNSDDEYEYNQQTTYPMDPPSIPITAPPPPIPQHASSIPRNTTVPVPTTTTSAPPPVPGAAPSIPHTTATVNANVAPPIPGTVPLARTISPTSRPPPPPPPHSAQTTSAPPPHIPEDSKLKRHSTFYAAPPPPPPSASTLPPPVPSTASSVPPPIPSENIMAPVETRSQRRTSTAAQSGRQSIESIRYTIDTPDLTKTSTNCWWISEDLPSHVSPRDVYYEVDSHDIQKRGNRTIRYLDYYIVSVDLAVREWDLAFDLNNPSKLLFFNETSEKPKIDLPTLKAASSKYGSLSYRTAAGALNSVFEGDFIDFVFSQLPKDVLKPIAGKTFGAVVYRNNNGVDIKQLDEIRPGDVLVVLKGVFESHSGALRKLKVSELGFGGKPAVSVITSFDAAKGKLKVIEQDNGIVQVNSYKIGNFKTGKLRVFRIVGRDCIGW